MKKVRLDELLVVRGLARDRLHARSLAMAGSVLVQGVPNDKAGSLVAADAELRLREKGQYVSRGGEKLEAALRHFDLDVTGCVALDIGASSGGFTDCLLQHGAAKVFALDVGENQLDWKLRSDARVVVLERWNAREIADIPAHVFKPVPSFVAIDLSFISPRKVLAAMLTVVSRDVKVLLLVKPQFELPKKDVSKGGVVRDPDLHAKACRLVAEHAEELGLSVSEPFASPVVGKKPGIRNFSPAYTENSALIARMIILDTADSVIVCSAS